MRTRDLPDHNRVRTLACASEMSQIPLWDVLSDGGQSPWNPVRLAEALEPLRGLPVDGPETRSAAAVDAASGAVQTFAG
jgi:hypothetical protein